MPKWIEVAKTDAFENQVETVDYDGIRIAVFKLPEGFFAINDECSHEEASLAEGDIINECEISCPLHGARFDIRNGQNLSFPAVVPVDAYPTKVEDETVLVLVED